jgi:hypothetical protein
MYACVPEIGGGFFEGVCWLEDRPLVSRDPPPPLCHSRIDPGRCVLAAHRSGFMQSIVVMDFQGRNFHVHSRVSLQSMRLAPPSGIMDAVANPKEELRLARRREAWR